MDHRAIVIRGDFTDTEFAELVAFIRRLDNARPDAFFEIVQVDPANNSLEIGEQMLRAALPEMPGRTTKWSGKWTFE